jgi:hypothetical protein
LPREANVGEEGEGEWGREREEETALVPGEETVMGTLLGKGVAVGPPP